eukprot:scaffold9214_cov125-Skeletonema_dohrnii-CCMP3373.AAC.2
MSQQSGVCVRHGAKVKLCSSEGCTNYVRQGGVCIRHGAKVKRCSSEGCRNNAQIGGECNARGMEQEQESTYAAMKGAYCLFSQVECAGGIGQIALTDWAIGYAELIITIHGASVSISRHRTTATTNKDE